MTVVLTPSIIKLLEGRTNCYSTCLLADTWLYVPPPWPSEGLYGKVLFDMIVKSSERK